MAMARASRWRMVRAALLVVVGATGVAAVFDHWYHTVLISRERERVLAYATPYSSALESAVGRRTARLAGLRTFAQTRRSLAQLHEEFPTFADGLRAGAPGIRALELVRDGRITDVVPLDSNPNVLGYDLYSDVRPYIPGDARRAIETGVVTMTGPINLLQGGVGFIVRQRVVRADSGFPDLVAMVLDLPTLVAEADAFSRPTSLSLVVLDRKREVLAGPSTLLDEPVVVPIRVPDGGWTLLAAPAEGWAAAVADDVRPTRVASVVIVLLLGWLTYVVASNQQRLRTAVEEQTRDLRDANDALTGQVLEREAAEQRLREQDERLRLALTSGQMGTWDYHPASDEMQLSAGALALLGRPAASREMTGRAFRDSLPPEARDVVQNAARLALATGECRVELRIATPSGGDRWLYCTGEVQSDRDGSKRFVGVVMDVTERRRLEEQLLHSQKMEAVGTLAGGIAHDFNNLLTGILGFARLSQQQAAGLETAPSPDVLRSGVSELRVDLDEIVKAGERAALLTAQLLAFSRRQVIKLSRVDLSGVVFDVERMLRRLIGERIALVTQHSPTPLFVRADAGQMAQVVVNLVVNARDAIPDGGTIRVATESVVLADGGEPPFAGLPAGRWCVLSVSDDGIGMSPDVMSRMFEPFFTTKLVGEGTGLGLSTVYGIVTQAGGQILVDSTPNVGTTVRVALPWNAVTEPHVPAAHPSRAAVTPASGPRVLVVEDEPGLRRLVAEILTRSGFAVDVARDGQEALEIMETGASAPDLVLTDVVMPRLGGAALATALTRRGHEVPVLFMSGYPADAEVPLDERHAFIGKPFTPDALVRKIRELLAPG